MWKAFTSGVKEGCRQWRIGLIVYCIQLMMAITIGLQVFQVLEASIGNSLEIEKLMEGFDNTVFTDFLNVHGASITPLIGQLRYLILIYLVFSIFINSGILYSVVEKTGTWKNFWKGAAAYFYPFFKLTIFFVLILLIWTIVLWFPLLMVLGPGLENFSSEVPMIQISVIVLIIYLLGVVIIFNWSVAARILYINDKRKIGATIKSGFQWLKRNILKSIGLFLLFALIQFLLVLIYFCLGQEVGMTTPLLILLFVICQQALVYFRILWRIMLYSGINQLII